MGKLKSLLAFLVWAAATDAAEPRWHLLVEPSFMRYESAWPIVGSESAVLVPARYEGGEVLPLKRDEVLKLNANRKAILEDAPASASKVLANLKPEYVRDKNQVIQYAILRSESPLTASTVLAPEFPGLFRETLGEDLFICLPNRFTVFVFPRDSAGSLNLSDIIYAEYQSSPYPISREIFALRQGKLIAIGRYR